MEWKCRRMTLVGQSFDLHRLHFCICVNYFVLLFSFFFFPPRSPQLQQAEPGRCSCIAAQNLSSTHVNHRKYTTLWFTWAIKIYSSTEKNCTKKNKRHVACERFERSKKKQRSKRTKSMNRIVSNPNTQCCSVFWNLSISENLDLNFLKTTVLLLLRSYIKLLNHTLFAQEVLWIFPPR